MATRADYECIDCGRVHEDRVFDGPPPADVRMLCCNESDTSRARRVWSPVSIGAVAGAGGSPARTAT